MRQVKTLTEIKLLRSNLHQQLRYNEEKMTLQSGQIISTVNAFITGVIIEKGIYSLVKYFLSERERKQKS